MKKTLFGAAVVASLFTSAASAATAIDLSATNAATATQTVSLAAGSYYISWVQGAYTAASYAQNSQGQNVNWTDYYKYSLDGGNTYTFVGYNNNTQYSSAAAALSAYSAMTPYTLTLTSATNVLFSTGDNVPNSLGDNAGGTSLSLAAVPEPATWMMMIAGFGAVGYSMRRRKVANVTFA